MIVCIDPGSTNTGLVLMERDKVWEAKAISFPFSIKGDNEDLVERIEAIEWRVDDEIDRFRGCLEAIVIEGFAYFGGRSNAFTFQTPWVIGALIEHLKTRYGVPIFIQLSTKVLNPTKTGNTAWVKDACAEGREFIEGATSCTNDHTRSALAHGIYFYQDIEHQEYL